MPKVRMLDVKNRRIIDPALELARKDDLIRELQEAAEFEGKVAVKLAIVYAFGGDNPRLSCKDCPANAYSKHADGCDDCILKWARISVEEEMNNDI